MADVITGPGWYADPLAPTRRRFWGGAAWTARVSTGDDPPWGAAEADLAWTPALALLPRPVVPVVAEPPPAPVAPAPAPSNDDADDDADASSGGDQTPGPLAWSWPSTGEEPALADVLPPLAALFDAALPVPPSVAPAGAAEASGPPVAIAKKRRRRRLLAAAFTSTAILVAGAAVAGAGVLHADTQRPQVTPEQVYRDTHAGFSLRYPDDWRVLRRDADGGIRFAIGARGAPSTETNIVSVVVGADSAELPLLHTLADQLTESLRAQLPGVRLDTATRTQLAGAPGFRFVFRDPEATPPTRIEQYVGQTTSGRPLTVTVTIREARTAPTTRQLRDFVRSLNPS